MIGRVARTSPLVRSLRAAVPLLGAQGVVFAAGFALSAALVLLLSREDLAHFVRLRETLKWLVVLGGLGLSTGLLRVARERREERGALLVTTWIVTASISAVAVAVVAWHPRLREIVFGDAVAMREFAIFGWKTPFLVVFAATMAALHAGGRLGRMGVLLSGERGFVLACSVVGAWLGGLRGLVVGSVVASALAAVLALTLGRREAAGAAVPARFSPPLLGRLFRIGWPTTGLQILETLRPLLLLRVMGALDVSDHETGLLGAGMLFLLPMIAVPERIAQALYPTMLDENGEAADLDRTSGRMLLELALVSIPLLAGVCGLLTVVLPAVRGGEWAGAVPIAWALLPGVAAHGLSAHLGYIILVRHRLPRQAVISAVTLVATGGLAWWLVPSLGALGAALALSAALVLRGLLITAVAHGPTR